MSMAGEVRSPVKRRFFKRPSWAARVSDGHEVETSVDNVQPAEVEFSRSETVLEQLRLEQEERAQIRAKKEKTKEKEKGKQEVTSVRKAKRRKLSADPEGDREETNGGEVKHTDQDEVEAVTVTPSIEHEVIDVDGDSDDDVQIQPISPTKKKATADYDEVRYFSDEDLSDYTREERRQRRAKGKRRDIVTTPIPLSESVKDRGPVVKLFVTSSIPGTSPLIVQRRIRQRLKEVRLAWCERQGFDADAAKDVFLTWRRRRIFDISTCESLGITVDATGTTSFKDSRGSKSSQGIGDVEDVDGAQLHMEAWTTELFEQAKQEREAARALKGRVDVDDEEPPNSQPPVKSHVGIKVVLKAIGYDDYKLVVKPTTLFDQIISVYRSQRPVPDDKTVFLMFDGERLDERSDVQSSEIGDLDYIEVHIR